ncbi:MAG: type II secretion system protein GspG [Thermodesulfovibrionales bacterium]
MKVANSKGFTLIEVIVVAGIIAILAGILVPLIFKEIDESKITRAAADVKSISTVMFVFRKDTGSWPLMDGNCSPAVTFLSGAGNLDPNLAGLGYDTSVPSSYNDHFSSDANNCYSPNWKGPYIATVSADPWGNAYVTNANGFELAGQPIWIISAGPNKQLETNANDTALQGDDIGVRIAGNAAAAGGGAGK